jgi:hypothetical protein
LSTNDTTRRLDVADGNAEPTSAPVGQFADLFASRIPRSPLRSFLPGRRAWLGLGVAAGAAALAAAAVAGLFDAGGSGGRPKAPARQGTVQQIPSPSAGPAAQPARPAAMRSASPSPSGAPGTPGTAPGTARDSHAKGPAAPRQANNSASGAQSGFLSATGSPGAGTGTYWSEDDLSFTSAVPLSSLRVTVRVAQTGGVTSTGTWCTLGKQADIGVTSGSGAVTYVVTLKPGTVLPAGTYTFAAQFRQSGSRSVQYDSFDVTGGAADSGSLQNVKGHY